MRIYDAAEGKRMTVRWCFDYVQTIRRGIVKGFATVLRCGLGMNVVGGDIWDFGERDEASFVVARTSRSRHCLEYCLA